MVARISRPKYRVCRDCEQECAPRRQWCYECHLAKRPPVERAEAATRRLSLVPEGMRRATVDKSEWPPGRRWCAGCQTFVRLRDCNGSRCKACMSIANHKTRTKAAFGITPEDYQWMMKHQLGKCAICRARPKTTRFAVDHDHKHDACKGKGCRECVRGLLCSVRCNHDLLGAAHDSVEILRNAIAYLENPPFRGDWQIPEREREEWERQYGEGTDPAPF